MTFAARIKARPETLPPLGGVLLAAYTIAWAVLAAAGIGLVAISLLFPSAPAGIPAVINGAGSVFGTEPARAVRGQGAVL